MNRRRFAGLIAGAALGMRVADEVAATPVADVDAGGYFVLGDLADEIEARVKRYERDLLDGTGNVEPRGFLHNDEAALHLQMSDEFVDLMSKEWAFELAEVRYERELLYGTGRAELRGFLMRSDHA